MRLIQIEDILTHEFIWVEAIPCLSIIHSNPVKNKFFWVEVIPCLSVIHSFKSCQELILKS
jgi:hypothetical protein